MLPNEPDVLTLKEMQKILHIGKNTALKLIEEKEPKTENSYRKLKVPKPVIAEIMKRKEVLLILIQ